MYGKKRVSSKLAIQFVNIATAKAVLRASDRKHSATYRNGIGPLIKNNQIVYYFRSLNDKYNINKILPKPTANDTMNRTMQTMLKYDKTM
jgi:hypothetical protein